MKRVPLVKMGDARIVVNFNVSLCLVTTANGVYRVHPGRLVVPELLRRSQTVTYYVMIRLVNVTRGVGAARLRRPHRPAVVRASRVLRIATRVSICGNLGNVHECVCVRRFPFIVMRGVCEAGAMIRQRLPRANSKQVAHFVRVVGLRASVRFSASNVLLLRAVRFE